MGSFDNGGLVLRWYCNVEWHVTVLSRGRRADMSGADSGQAD